MKKKDTEFSWAELVEKADPSIRTRPVATYTFNNGKRVFYEGRKKSGHRKG